jgi:Ser/Thr protein kinase RdoA (MazF antagonist)
MSAPFVAALTSAAGVERVVRGLNEMLEQSDIAHYLLSLGLVKPRSVVDGDLTIVDASRRNSVFVATTRHGPAYVVKQARSRSARTLAHEAAVLRVLAREPTLAGHVPRVAHEDVDAARLVLRSPGGGRDWREQHRAGRFPLVPARALGRTLAAVHGIAADAVDQRPAGSDPMWGLSLAEPPWESLLDMSTGAHDLLARMQASSELCDRLRDLGETAADGALVHGDLRWDNCIAFAAPGSKRRTRVALVDWELAGRGVAAFDVAMVLAEYLVGWVESIPVVDPGDPGRLAARARRPLARIQPAIGAFWGAYRCARSKPPALRLVVELAAVRLLQAAIEYAQAMVAASALVVTLLQVADNMLRRPHDAAESLLGLQE